MKILIAEDEKKLSEFMADGLRQAGYLVKQCYTGTDATAQAASEDFDLLLLDLMLPGMNGFDVLKNLRSLRISTAVIIVSALGNTKEVVEGLDLGAVDYIKKPFEWEELLARIRNVQRKLFRDDDLVIRIDGLVIEVRARKVARDGREIMLTQKEFLLLEYLARNANRVLSRNQLLENAWGLDFDPESNIVEVYMYQLRQKIDKGAQQPLIKTVVGAGYMLKGNKSAA